MDTLARSKKSVTVIFGLQNHPNLRFMRDNDTPFIRKGHFKCSNFGKEVNLTTVKNGIFAMKQFKRTSLALYKRLESQPQSSCPHFMSKNQVLGTFSSTPIALFAEFYHALPEGF